MKKKPDKSPEPMPRPVTIHAAHGSRQVPAWLIFDVRRKMKKASKVIGIIAAINAAAYALAFHFRSPAANLAYWCYTPGDSPAWAEDAAYAAFYPAYIVHRAVLSGPRHTFNREEIPVTALAQP